MENQAPSYGMYLRYVTQLTTRMLETFPSYGKLPTGVRIAAIFKRIFAS